MTEKTLARDDLDPGRSVNVVELVGVLGDESLAATVEFHAGEYRLYRRCLQRLSCYEATDGCRQSRSKLRLCDQSLQSIDVPSIITRFVDRCFGDESRMSQAQIVEQTAERFYADHSVPDVLVPIEPRSSRSFRVIAVPDLHALEADRRIEMLQGLIEAFLADDVAAGNMSVAGVDAGPDGNDS